MSTEFRLWDLVVHVGDSTLGSGVVVGINAGSFHVQWSSSGGGRRIHRGHDLRLAGADPAPSINDVLAALRDLLAIVDREGSAFRSHADQETLRNARAVAMRGAGT